MKLSDIDFFYLLVMIFLLPMKSLDLKKLFEKYTGLWVALTVDNHVITAHKSAKETYDQALKKGYSDPILFKVPTEDMPFIGQFVGFYPLY